MKNLYTPWSQLGTEHGIVSTARARSQLRNYSRDLKLRKRYGIPERAGEIDGVEGYTLTHSELLCHTGHAGKSVKRLFALDSYGYVITVDGHFVHGALHIGYDEDRTISLS